MPKTAHGKLDRAALRLAPIAREPQAAPASAPRTALEREVCRCFGEALGTDGVGIDDDFFLIGGHSLLVVPLCAAISAALGTEVNVVDVFEYPTARQLARALGRRGSGAPAAAFAAP
jgi:hypothetical protein